MIGWGFYSWPVTSFVEHPCPASGMIETGAFFQLAGITSLSAGRSPPDRTASCSTVVRFTKNADLRGCSLSFAGTKTSCNHRSDSSPSRQVMASECLRLHLALTPSRFSGFPVCHATSTASRMSWRRLASSSLRCCSAACSAAYLRLCCAGAAMPQRNSTVSILPNSSGSTVCAVWLVISSSGHFASNRVLPCTK